MVICVSADEDLRAVIAGLEPGLSPTHDRDGLLHRRCGNGARRCMPRLAALGVGFLDCPVSGGVEGARAATLAIMVGGDEAVFARALPILEKLGKTIAHFGPSGAGQAAKATNQIMCAGIIQAVGEAMAFAHAEGLPLDRLIDTLGKGAGSSWYFVNRAPFMAKNAFPGRISRAPARKGPADLPRHGGTARRAAAGRRIDPAAVCAA